ncbi:MAG: Kynurenine formamidase [Streptosporangiaceae bacterium]|nr:Kynurenine formamidase [Streptosporangiaceae bacterium]
MTVDTVVNLTMPISPYLPVGGLHAWESAYRTEPIATLEHNGANLFYITMCTGTGTRLRTPGFGDATGAQIPDMPLTALVNVPAYVLRVPKGPGEAITAADVDDALGGLPDWAGQALILVTGWGDAERWEQLGERYALETPHLSTEAAEIMASRMAEHGSTLLLTDCAHLDRASVAREEWADLPPWLRPSWPSDQAKAYVRHYTPEKVARDWQATLTLTRSASVVVGLAGAGALAAAEVQLTVLPLFIDDVAEAPCTVVAESLEGIENR